MWLWWAKFSVWILESLQIDNISKTRSEMKFYEKEFDAKIPRKPPLGLHLQNKCWKLVRLYVICCDYNSPVAKIHMKEKNTAWTNTFLETIIIEKFRVLTLSRKRGNISDRRLSIKEMPVLNLHTFFYIRVTCHVISTYISWSLVVFVIECLWNSKISEEWL